MVGLPMPDENRFAGLSEAVDEDEESTDEPESGEPATGESTGDASANGDGDANSAESSESAGIVDSPNIADIPESADSADIVECSDGVDGGSGSDDAVSTNDTGEQAATTADDEIQDMNSSGTADGAGASGTTDVGSDEESANSADSSNIVESVDIADRVDIADSGDIPESGDSSDVPNSVDAEEETGPSDDEPAPSVAGSAFGFDDTDQHSVYVRSDAWQQFEDAEALVDARLRAEHDVRDLTGREFHDAVLRVASEHEDELVEAILAARKED